MKEQTINVLFNIFVLFCAFALGFVAHIGYQFYTNQQTIRGLYIREISNYSSALEAAKGLDRSGQWICINVNEDMQFKDLVTTCEHEAGHELFARKCTANPEMCFKLMEEMEKNEKG